jgi:hypothetical protein
MIGRFSLKNNPNVIAMEKARMRKRNSMGLAVGGEIAMFAPSCCRKDFSLSLR